MPTSDPNITVIVETFAIQITAAVEAAMADRLQAAIAGAFGAPPEYRADRKATPAGTAKPAAAKKAAKATPKVARARKLQGQYLGALKSLKGADRAKVKAIAKDKGVAAAVKLAAGMKKGKA